MTVLASVLTQVPQAAVRTKYQQALEILTVRPSPLSPRDVACLVLLRSRGARAATDEGDGVRPCCGRRGRRARATSRRAARR
jgi:hypothetical protein